MKQILVTLIISCFSLTGVESQNVKRDTSAQTVNIFDAVKQHQLEDVKKIMASDHQLVNATDERQMTPLHYAAEKGYTDIAEFLIGKGADINAKNARGSKPIHIASVNGQLETVKLLVKHGANIQEPNTAGLIPLRYAVISGNTELVDYFFYSGVPKNVTGRDGSNPALWAANAGQIKMLEHLIAKGYSMDSKDHEGYTLLHWASSGGKIDMIEYLIKEGMNIRTKAPNGITPVESALFFGQMTAVEYLLDHGLKIDESLDDQKNTILHRVVFSPHPNTLMMTKRLIELGAPVNAVNFNGITPLANAVAHGNLELLDLLLKNGAEVNTKKCIPKEMNCEHYATPLHFAAIEQPRSVKFLIENGADVNATDDENNTPVHNAAHSDSVDNLKLLITAGARINEKNNDSMTPLHIAVRMGKQANVETLLRHGAGVNETDQNGQTALHYAFIKGYKPIAELLISKGSDVTIKDRFDHLPSYYASYYYHKDLLNISANHNELQKLFPDINHERPLNQGEAKVFYLNHSAIAVKTQNHFLIFDYWENGAKPASPSLYNGHINPEEIKDLNVTVFVSHAHQDHYIPAIWNWKSKIKNIRYVMGFQPAEAKDDFVFINPGDSKEIPGMNIATIRSNDSGVGFIVTVDGLTLFHAGDHANRKRDFSEPYREEIDRIVKENKKIDIALLPVSGCGFGDMTAVKMGVLYALGKLSPKVFMPVHGNGNTFQKFADENKKEIKNKTAVWYALNNGDRFEFRNGKIVL